VKKVLLFIILNVFFSLVSTNIFSQKSVLVGKVYNASEKEINITYFKNYITNEVERKSIILNDNNTFQINFDTKDTFQCIFNYQSYNINLLMFPNDTTFMVFDAQKMLNTINFEGKNKSLNLLDARLTSTFERWNDKVVMNEINNRTYDDYKDFVEDLFFKKSNYICDFKEQNELTPSQVAYAYNNLHYWRASKLLEYDYIKADDKSNNGVEHLNNHQFLQLLDSSHFSISGNENNFIFNNLLYYYLDKIKKKENAKMQSSENRTIQKIQKFVNINIEKINIVKYPGSDEVIGEAFRHQKFQSANCYTDEAFQYKFNDSITYNSKFAKIKFNEQSGWLPMIGVTIEDTIVEETTQYNEVDNETPILFDENTQSLIHCILLIRKVNNISKDTLNAQLNEFSDRYPKKKRYLFVLKSIIEQWQENMYDDGRFKTPIFNVIEVVPSILNRLLKQCSKIGINNFTGEIVESQNGVGEQFISGMTKNEQLMPYQVSVNSELERYYSSNKILVVDFWATWCMPCIRQIKSNQGLIEKINPEEVEFIFINIDSDKRIAKEYIAAEKLLGKHIFDNNKEIFYNLNIKGVPTMMIFDRNRKVIYNSTDLWEHPLSFILEKYSN
jgi:thiol-disulfide isomerase/thioredoxin